MYDIEIYQGRGTVEVGPFSLGEDVLMRLLRSLEPRAGHKIFFDNLFSSVDHVVHLKEIGYDCVGTIRQNRLSGYEPMEEKEIKRFHIGKRRLES